MPKLSRRLFLLALLSACAPLPSALIPASTRPAPTPSIPPAPATPLYPTLVGLTPLARAPTLVPFAAFASQPTPTDDGLAQINQVVFDADTLCRQTLAAPPKPAVIPAAEHVDAATGRHFMGTVQVLDPARYRLEVGGLVDHPLSLKLDDLLCLPKVTETVTTVCYSFSDTATWSGVQISAILKKAGLRPGAQKLVQTAADGIVHTVTLDMALDPHNFLAYEMEGKPLPILFGFPLRSIFIDVAGQYSVKWLTSLKIA